MIFIFSSGLNHKSLGCSQPGSSWKDGGVQACVSWSSVCKQMSSMHSFDSGLPVKVFPNRNLLLNSVNFFLVAITVGKKLRLMEKNKNFYESDCVEG